MEKLEFRVSPDGKVYYKKDNEDEKRLTRFCNEICTTVYNVIRKQYPGAYSRLRLIYKPQANTNHARMNADYKMVERFVRCNFGSHDLLTPDVENGILNFEEVRCPLRGMCPDENIVCKPKSIVHLTENETKVVRLYLRGYTLKEIAETLKKSQSTINNQLHSISKKVGAKNCREIIKVMRVNNVM